MSTDTFRAAAAHRIPFGQYFGKAIDTVAESDAGLLHLDWMRGELVAGRLVALQDEQPALINALATYLEDPAIAGYLAKLVESCPK